MRLRLHIVSLLALFILLGCTNPKRNNGTKKTANTRNSTIGIVDGNKDNSEAKNDKSKSDLTSAELYKKCNDAVCMIYCKYNDGSISQGSGFFVNDKGMAVSNYHVFEGAIKGEAYIKMTNNNYYQVVDVVTYNKEHDFIVFNVGLNGNRVKYLEIADEQPSVGEKVVAIGSPEQLANTISEGIVSSYRENDYLIQISLPITHGSSGGPLINMRGEVVGITTSGMGVANLNFAMNIQRLGIKELLR